HGDSAALSERRPPTAPASRSWSGDRVPARTRARSNDCQNGRLTAIRANPETTPRTHVAFGSPVHLKASHLRLTPQSTAARDGFDCASTVAGAARRHRH